MAHGHEGERGQALVEFALSVVVLFAVLFGVIDFGRALYTYDLVTAAARVGTRYAVVRGSTCTFADCPATQTSIQTYVRSMVTGVTASNLTVTTTWPSGNSPGSPVKVAVSYPFTYFLISTLPALTMTSTSEMIISQ